MLVSMLHLSNTFIYFTLTWVGLQVSGISCIHTEILGVIQQHHWQSSSAIVLVSRFIHLSFH